MSFLVSDKDQLATLWEVLAFIDSSEFDEASTTRGSSDDDATFPVGKRASKDEALGKDKPVKGRKRKRRNLSSSTRLQQCKRAEILYLRKRVVELEEQLQRAQTGSKHPRTPLSRHEASLEAKPTGKAMAEANYHARLLSEEANHHLKQLLANHMQASETLCGLLRKQSAFQEMNCVAIQSIQSPAAPTLDDMTLGSEITHLEPLTLPAC